jgi:holliday junction DNA helicase RuvA
MFAYIKGIIQEKEALSTVVHRAIIECHGFGLEIQISQNTLLQLPEIGEQTQVHTVFFVKETEFLLFGFAALEEKELFLLLTSVSGIGPKLALALLGTLTPVQLSEAILEQDESLITQAPGVGAKVAKRIILELKTKVENWHHKNLAQQNSYAGSQKQTSIVVEEARSILTGLGYSPNEITSTLTTLKREDTHNDVELLVRESLKLLGAGKISPSIN